MNVCCCTFNKILIKKKILLHENLDLTKYFYFF